ncbi:AHH domain-containing protein [Corallococcus sp. BB11-1]|nr:AHH domain-containing protein [Corallococcus sp. BB11-1]
MSGSSGGPWTPQFERYFRRTQMDLNDLANKVRIDGHRGPHPREYHQAVLDRIAKAMNSCKGADQCRAALVGELAKIAKDLVTAGTEMRKLITKTKTPGLER